MVLTGDTVPERRASQIKGGRTGRGRDIKGPTPPGEPSGLISATGTELATLSPQRDTRPQAELFALRLSNRAVPETSPSQPTRPREAGPDGRLAPGLRRGWGHETPAARWLSCAR